MNGQYGKIPLIILNLHVLSLLWCRKNHSNASWNSSVWLYKKNGLFLEEASSLPKCFAFVCIRSQAIVSQQVISKWKETEMHLLSAIFNAYLNLTIWSISCPFGCIHFLKSFLCLEFYGPSHYIALNSRDHFWQFIPTPQVFSPCFLPKRRNFPQGKQ